MKKLVGFLFFMMTVIVLAQAQSDNFVLITMLYNEKKEERIAEYIMCMEKNLVNPRIDTIHVFYDVSNDNEKNTLLDYLRFKQVVIKHIHGQAIYDQSLEKNTNALNSDKRVIVSNQKNMLVDCLGSKQLVIHYINERVTYDQCFELANALHPDRHIIVSNADMYYDETLGLLDTYDLTDKFLALTRWNVLEDGTIQTYMWPRMRPAIGSQDTWIFKTPIRSFQDKTIQMGVPHCDIRLAYQAKQSGLVVLNPCLSLRCCHLHLSCIRNYTGACANGSVSAGVVPKEIMFVPWCTLD